MARRRWATVLAGVFALALVLAACGGDDGNDGGATGGATATGATATGSTATGSTGATGGASGGDAITIANFAFDPSTLEVSGPTTITVTNEDSATHTFTTDDGSVDEEIASGDSVQVEIDISQDTGFHCRIHPSMTGTLTVG